MLWRSNLRIRSLFPAYRVYSSDSRSFSRSGCFSGSWSGWSHGASKTSSCSSCCGFFGSVMSASRLGVSDNSRVSYLFRCAVAFQAAKYSSRHIHTRYE